MKRRAARAVLITNAERSQEDQLRTRTVRYVAMMSIRIVCLVLAVVLVSLNPPLLWLWLALCAIGMILIPWVAVVLANDRLPKDRHRLRRPGRRSRRRLASGQTSLPVVVGELPVVGEEEAERERPPAGVAERGPRSSGRKLKEPGSS